ncbi:AMP-binding protein, partial [Flavobacterium psychroterrae]
MDISKLPNKNNFISKYWKKKAANRERVFLLNAEQKTLPNIIINTTELSYFSKLTNNKPLAQYAVLSAVYSFLLTKLTYEFDGYIVSNYKEHNNPLLLSFPIDLKVSFKEYLQTVKYEILEVLKYSDFNDQDLYNKIDFGSLSSFSNFGLKLNGNVTIDCNGILFDIEISDESLKIKVSYLQEFINESLVKCLANHFKHFIVDLEKYIDSSLSNYPLLSALEKSTLLESFNATTVSYPEDKTIVDLFESQVFRTPNNIAVVYEDVKLTYQELNERANQLGAYLRVTYGVGPDDLIGIRLERSELMLISILGILKAGGAYVPIDPGYPAERISYIEKDSNCKVVIDREELLSFDKVCTDFAKTNISKINKPTDLAYVIYTSGTTGNPKGVMISHTSLVNRLEWMQKAYPLSCDDVILQKTSYSFDVSVWELLWWMYNGASVSFLKPDAHKDPQELVEAIFNHKVTVMHFVPSMLGAFLNYLKEHPAALEKLGSLVQVFTSGEALTVHQNNTFFELLSTVSLMNLYGPTEAAIDVSYFKCA